jgi:hypothetical protein
MSRPTRPRRRGPGAAVLVLATMAALAGLVARPGHLAGARPARPAQATGTPILTALPPVDTPTPVPTALPPVTTPTVAPAGNVCPQILKLVPAAAINAAVQNPGAVYGFNRVRDPGKPESPFNQRRTWLSIHAYSKPYHPLFNALEYKVGCP